jgi:hypothetical protein
MLDFAAPTTSPPMLKLSPIKKVMSLRRLLKSDVKYGFPSTWLLLNQVSSKLSKKAEGRIKKFWR